MPIDFGVINLEDADDEEVKFRVNLSAQEPFKLEEGPLLRVRLFCCSDGHQIFLLVVHHIVADGWSLWVLLDELQTVYAAILRGALPDLKPLKATYSEFVRWQRQMSSDDAWNQHSRFWLEHLTGEYGRLELPANTPRPPAVTFDGSAVRSCLEADLVRELRQLSNTENVTPASLLMAAFQVLLFRLSGQREFLVGLATLGRGLTRFEGIVGYFVNVLPIRARLEGTQSFKHLLKGVHSDVGRALAHQDYPFPLMVRDAGFERDPARHPLLDAAFVYNKPQREELDLSSVGFGDDWELHLGGWDVRWFELERKTSIYDLSLQVTDRDDSLYAEFEYRTDLFDEEMIRSLANSFGALLAGISTGADRAINKLPLLNDQDRCELLYGWNDTEVERPGTSIHHLFEDQAARTPSATAVVSRGGSWSYEQVNTRANQLAHFLRNKGVRPGDTVGVHLPRSHQYLTAVMAVLKSGAAFLPLEQTLPVDRLAFLITDSHTGVVVTDCREAFQQLGLAIQLLDLNQIENELASLPLHNMGGGADSDFPAYVIYTSGSSGQPKGVSISHRSVSNLLADVRRRFELTAEDLCFAHSTIAFDATILEMFMAPSVGASIFVVDQDSVVDGFRLVESLEQSGATLVVSTPAFWNLVVESGWQGGKGIKAICGGDDLPRQVAEQVTSRGVSLHNVYGATELTVICTAGEAYSVSKNLTVGRPMENVQVYILDGEMEPVPPGIPGEIFIGGEPVAIGYVDRPGLTAERFVPDPFGGRPGARLYRSGDRGRFRRDGTIEFLGRLDRQVQIRGYRVEPGEVENVLNRHSQILASVVIARDRPPAGTELVAFIQPHEHHSLTVADLRKYLGERLPAYMIPVRFGFVSEFPLTSHGKIDRRKLSSFDTEGTLDERPPPGFPRTELETRLAHLMAEVLEVDQVEITHSFFELGGHSLLAVRFLTQVEIETGQRVAMAEFLKNPTVRHTAELLRSTFHMTKQCEPIPCKVGSAPGSRFPLTQGQQAIWYVEELEPDQALYNISAAWRIQGKLNLTALEASLSQLVSRHGMLRSRLRDKGHLEWELMAPECVSLKKVDLSDLEQTQQALLIHDTLSRLASQPFDLLVEAPFRTVVIRLNGESHILVFVAHHIAIDGWSTGILLDELSQLYAAYDQNRPVDLHEPECRFGDYALWLQDLVRSGELKLELDYWTKQLAEIPVLELSRRRTPTSSLKRKAGVVECGLSEELVGALKRLGHQYNASLFATLMAAFQVWVYRHADQDDFGVGFPVTGRLRPEIGGLIGYFVNVLVLRSRIDPSRTFGESLQSVRDELIEALKNQTIPFECVVKATRPQRTGGQNPLFQVLFTVEPELIPQLQLRGTEIVPIQEMDQPAAFDLVMSISQVRQGMTIKVKYDRELFEADEIGPMAERFVTLLENLVDDPDSLVGEVNLLSEEERRLLLVEWNQTQAEYPRRECIHELFEGHAAVAPQAPAVISGNTCLTYAELNAKANQLARHLKAIGVGPGDVVGVLMPRSAALLVSILAVFKAGGIYLPLDPDFPIARLDYMIDDAGARAIIASRAGSARCREHGLPVCNLDEASGQLHRYPTENLESNLSSMSSAYLVYTSGSSGRPKGVLVSHCSAVNVLFYQCRMINVVSSDVMLAHMTIAFDASISELFMPLVFGAAVYPVSRGASADPLHLIKVIEENRVTLLHSTPDFWSLLLAAGWQKGVGLTGFVGGQKLHRSLAEQVLQRGVRLINNYGPTEATMMCANHEVVSGVGDIPIGRPASNVSMYVLDEQMQPVPVGLPGEIFIGGDSLAFGYVNRPALTAERFVPDPFSQKPGARLYRSGDVGRYRFDGNIEFLGRRDRQVKIRGYRVELGEIENRLLRNEKVSQAVVAVKEAAQTDRRLAAYVVTKGKEDVGVEDLKSALKSELPGYMLPSAFVFLNSLPLTASGKVDLEALPEPEWGERTKSVDYQAPRTETEVRLAAIWTDLLKVSEVGVADNFFEWGGHSLLAVQMIHRIESEFGCRLPLTTILEEPTIRHLADTLTSGEVTHEALVSLRSEGTQQPLFLVTAGYGDMVALSNVVSRMESDRAVYGLQPGSVVKHPARGSIDGLVDIYLDAIRSKQAVGPYLLAGYCSGGLIAAALAKRIVGSGEEVEKLILMDTPTAYPHLHHAIFERLRRFQTRLLGSAPWIRSRLPQLLRPSLLDEGLMIHLNALAGYRMTEYRGSVTLILASRSHVRFSSGRRSWKKIVRGELTTLVVTGRHSNFVRGKNAVELAGQLDLSLQDGSASKPVI